jgi:hypothetical protein
MPRLPEILSPTSDRGVTEITGKHENIGLGHIVGL